MSHLLVVDPSINSLGWAVFSDGSRVSSGCIKADYETKEMPLEYRIQMMIVRLSSQAIMSLLGERTMVIEEPEMFSSSTSMAAVHNSSLKKLLMIVGALVWYGYNINVNVVLIPVTTWKGQLPKHITISQMETMYSRKFDSTDEPDALALGNWYLRNGESWLKKLGRV